MVDNGVFLVRNFIIRTEYVDLLCKSPYSVRMMENIDQKTPYLDNFHAFRRLILVSKVIVLRSTFDFDITIANDMLQQRRGSE